jgi:hypothetical protein
MTNAILEKTKSERKLEPILKDLRKGCIPIFANMKPLED